MNSMVVNAKYVHDVREIEAGDVNSFGGKATGLARMALAGIPVPPAVVIGTRGYHSFVRNGGTVIDTIAREIHDGIRHLERATGKCFASSMPPLLVSVRSGAAISMPGMMDTILNLGLDAASALEFAQTSQKTDFVLDTWMRFWRMYSETVLDLDGDDLDSDIEAALEEARNAPSSATFGGLEAAILEHIKSQGCEASADPHKQLIEVVAAVFRSWNSPRAKAYRAHHKIPNDMGTAVTIQAMAFGNADAHSGTGVAFTRDPNTGENILYGEYLTGHQGEDLVAGTHTPIKLSDATMPCDLVVALHAHGRTLEQLYRDAVDIEFTVESGSLYFLQVRAAKRTAAAAIRIATDLVEEGLISEADGIARASQDQVLTLLKPSFEPQALKSATLLAEGLGSSPGQRSGAAVLDSDRAAEYAAEGKDVILLRPITSPQDIRGMLASNGIVTARGGALSHAAVVSRALNKPCIVGCEKMDVDVDGRRFSVGGQSYPEGTAISIDGATGKVYLGTVPVSDAAGSNEALSHYLELADKVSGADVWTAPRSQAELLHSELGGGGIALIGLTDLVRACDLLPEFTAAVSRIAHNEQNSSEMVISDIAAKASRSLFAVAGERPVHIRLPQLGSERAKQLLPDWETLAAAQFLPLGNLLLLRALLKGVSDAAGAYPQVHVTVFAGGISTLGELAAFQREVGGHDALTSGLIIQNFAMLRVVLESREFDSTSWLDVNEIIRTVHGLPSHLQQMSAIFDDYYAGNLSAANPFSKPAEFLTQAFVETGQLAGEKIGILDAHILCDDLLLALYRAGFRRFSTSISGRNETRLKLARKERG